MCGGSKGDNIHGSALGLVPRATRSVVRVLSGPRVRPEGGTVVGDEPPPGLPLEKGEEKMVRRCRL